MLYSHFRPQAGTKHCRNPDTHKDKYQTCNPYRQCFDIYERLLDTGMCRPAHVFITS